MCVYIYIYIERERDIERERYGSGIRDPRFDLPPVINTQSKVRLVSLVPGEVQARTLGKASIPAEQNSFRGFDSSIILS